MHDLCSAFEHTRGPTLRGILLLACSLGADVSEVGLRRGIFAEANGCDGRWTAGSCRMRLDELENILELLSVCESTEWVLDVGH